jgi:REP element-mobilizing transposase RayT
MSHSLVKVHIHYVWSTKYGERLLIGDAREQVKNHISQYANQNNLHVEALTIQPEHVHLLVLLGRDQKIEDIAKLVKGESSHWINEHNIIKPKFSWQTGYAALSASYQNVGTVKRYIETQDEHHRRKTFMEEYTEMLKDYGYSESEIEELFGYRNR